MPRTIRMYNTHFGDCFVLTDDKIHKHLMVDFGIHQDSEVRLKKQEDIIEDVCKDVNAHYGSVELLITYFHYDHICGLTYQYLKKVNEFEISKVYLPDIFDYPQIISLVLAEELINIMKISKKKVSGYRRGYQVLLLDLLSFLGVNVKNVDFLDRGKKFMDEQYIDSLPDKKVKSYIVKKYTNLTFPDVLNSFRVRIDRIAQSVSLVMREVKETYRFNDNFIAII